MKRWSQYRYIRFSFNRKEHLESGDKRVFEVREPITDETRQTFLSPGCRRTLISRSRPTLSEMPGYDMRLQLGPEKTGAPARQHASAQIDLTHTFHSSARTLRRRADEKTRSQA